jgi:hypothetical protein
MCFVYNQDLNLIRKISPTIPILSSVMRGNPWEAQVVIFIRKKIPTFFA